MREAVYAEWDEDVADWIDERPSRRAARRSLPWLRIVLLSSCSIAGLVYLALEGEQAGRSPQRQRAVPSSVLIAPAPVWKAISPSPAPYALEKPSGPITLEARQNTGGTREDTVILGSFGDARSARISLVQGPQEASGSLFIDIVRRAALAGLAVARHAQSRMIETKFGAVEAAPMTLAGKAEQECQAFRFADSSMDFGFQGWLCGGASDDAQLACFIDGIALANATSPSLKALFAQAERDRSTACGTGARTAAIDVRPPQRP
jgi:hypothetical protein